MNVSLLWQYLPELSQALLTTVLLVMASIAVGLSLAIGFSYVTFSNNKKLAPIINGFSFVIRGTPLLVQIFIIYYGVGQFKWLQHSWLWIAFKQPFFCAVFAFALSTSVYTAEILRGAIQGINPGEIQAGRAFGLNHFLLFRRLVLPQALRLALPAYSNEVILVLKGTSLASTITLLDLMGMTQQIVAETYATMEFFLVLGVIYLCLNGCIMLLFKQLERRLIK